MRGGASGAVDFEVGEFVEEVRHGTLFKRKYICKYLLQKMNSGPVPATPRNRPLPSPPLRALCAQIVKQCLRRVRYSTCVASNSILSQFPCSPNLINY